MFYTVFCWAFKVQIPHNNEYDQHVIYQGTGKRSLVEALNHAGIDCRHGRAEWRQAIEDKSIVDHVFESVTSKQLHNHRVFLDREEGGLLFLAPSKTDSSDWIIPMNRSSSYNRTVAGDVERKV